METAEDGEVAGRHTLIFTPFRYRSPVASRFRRAADPGLWYGAEETETACAEVAFWKWRFLLDSDALAAQALHTEHSFFRAKVRGRCADLTTSPWKSAARTWRESLQWARGHAQHWWLVAALIAAQVVEGLAKAIAMLANDAEGL